MPAAAKSAKPSSSTINDAATLAYRYAELRALHVAAARRSSAAFTSFVMRDEAGIPFKLAPFHREWHYLFAVSQRIILWGSAEIGKSQNIIAYVAWRIGCDPSTRVVMVSKNKSFARKIMTGVAKVLRSSLYREVFPDSVVLQANGDFINVLGHDGVNHTVEAVQFLASIHGARIDLLILDDVLDRINTRTEDQREKMYQFYKDVYISRLTARAQVIFGANAWHPRDMLHRLQEEPGWICRRYPIWWDGPDGTKVPLWPERWSIERIVKKKQEFDKEDLYFRRVYECEPLDDGASTWDRKWIEAAERAGFGLPWPGSTAEAYGEVFRQIVIGVDLATVRPASRRKTDESVLAVVGQEAATGKKRLLHLRSGRWHGPQIVAEIKELRKRFHPAIPWVESNAAQLFIVDFCKEQTPANGADSGWIGMPADYAPPQPTYDDPIPVMSFDTTAQKKYDERFGVEAMGIEMSCGIWRFPNQAGVQQPIEYAKLVDEMMAYDPAQHAGDRLMALWIASEGLRLGMGGVVVVPGANGRPR